MAIPYEETGRTRQKTRTRDALLSAARELLAGGATPTVETAAEAAAVARATAYRYFPNQRALLVATFPEIAEPSLLGPDPPADLAERLRIVVAAIARQAVEHEAALRNMLRLSLEVDPGDMSERPFRTGRRIVWVGDALSPLRDRFDELELERLIHAIAAAIGIDALVWLTDIAGLSREAATEVMGWSAQALLQAALAAEQQNGEGGIRTRDGR